MKKVQLSVVALTLMLAMASVALAKSKSMHDKVTGQGYGAAGCGLGSVIFGDDEGMVQVLAATTNGTFYTQTFGISSGTSNCKPESGKHAANLNVYVESNQAALASDVARGGGDTVAGLSQILGCSDVAEFGHALQSNYEMIFPTQDVSASAVSQAIETVAQAEASCRG